jgi:hypothetical protein
MNGLDVLQNTALKPIKKIISHSSGIVSQYEKSIVNVFAITLKKYR